MRSPRALFSTPFVGLGWCGAAVAVVAYLGVELPWSVPPAKVRRWNGLVLAVASPLDSPGLEEVVEGATMAGWARLGQRAGILDPRRDPENGMLGCFPNPEPWPNSPRLA